MFAKPWVQKKIVCILGMCHTVIAGTWVIEEAEEGVHRATEETAEGTNYTSHLNEPSHGRNNIIIRAPEYDVLLINLSS